MTPQDIIRVQNYLRKTFRLDTLEVRRRSNKDDSAEVSIAGEFIGVIFKDVEDGETSFAFQMAILEFDLDTDDD